MDKEKLLKKFKMKIIIGYSFICSAAFVWMYIFTVGIINPKRWFTFGFVIVFLCLVVGYIDANSSSVNLKSTTRRSFNLS